MIGPVQSRCRALRPSPAKPADSAVNTTCCFTRNKEKAERTDKRVPHNTMADGREKNLSAYRVFY
jgi:hypothetical protein